MSAESAENLNPEAFELIEDLPIDGEDGHLDGDDSTVVDPGDE